MNESVDPKDELKEIILRASSNVIELTPRQRQAAVSALIDNVVRIPIPHKIENFDNTSSDHTKELRMIVTKGDQAASMKWSNYFISWKHLLLAGGSIPASYASATLSAMTLLSFLAKGAVHVFDQIDAKILGIIHKYSELLPLSTGEFYDRLANKFPQEINRALYMQRVVDLSGCGAIKIDDDVLTIIEVLYKFDR